MHAVRRGAPRRGQHPHQGRRPGPGWLAADRSMQAAGASEDPVTIASSARIITHAMMNSGHYKAAASTASTLAASFDHDVAAHDPESLSVYGSLLLRGAIAAAQDDNRHKAYELLTEADETASRLGQDRNLRWTAFGPINASLHRVNIAVTLGDAGTAIDVARTVDLAAIDITERKASFLMDTARAFLQYGRHDRAYLALRAAEDIAPEEITGRPAARRLVRDLMTTAPSASSARPRTSPAGSGPPNDLARPAADSHRVRRRPRLRSRPAHQARAKPRVDRPGHRHTRRARLHRRTGNRGQAGGPVRSQYRKPGEPRSRPADAIIVAPATYNTINKWAQGISDTYALGILAETTGLGVPIVVLPFVNAALAARAPFRRSIDELRREGARVLLGPGGIQPHEPHTGGDLIASYPWHLALSEAEHSPTWPPGSART